MKLKLLKIEVYGFYGHQDSEYLLVSVENGKEELLKYLSNEVGFTDAQMEEFREKLNNSEHLDLDLNNRDVIVDFGEIKDLRNETTV